METLRPQVIVPLENQPAAGKEAWGSTAIRQDLPPHEDGAFLLGTPIVTASSEAVASAVIPLSGNSGGK